MNIQELIDKANTALKEHNIKDIIICHAKFYNYCLNHVNDDALMTYAKLLAEITKAMSIYYE